MFRLGLPPIENHQYTCLHGRKVLSAESRRYYEAVSRELGGLPPLPVDGPLVLEITLFLKYDRDVSGCKILQDAVAAALGFNDRIIKRLVVEKAEDKQDPYAWVTLAPWKGDPHAL